MSDKDAGWGVEHLDLWHHPLFFLFVTRFWCNFFDMGHIPNKHSKIWLPTFTTIEVLYRYFVCRGSPCKKIQSIRGIGSHKVRIAYKAPQFLQSFWKIQMKEQQTKRRDEWERGSERCVFLSAFVPGRMANGGMHHAYRIRFLFRRRKDGRRMQRGPDPIEPAGLYIF